MRCIQKVAGDRLTLGANAALFFAQGQLGGHLVRISGVLTFLGFSAALAANSAAMAQTPNRDSIFIPERFAKCSKVDFGREEGAQQLNKCFRPTIERYYGRIYLAGEAPEFETLGSTRFRTEQEGRSFWQNIRSLFVTKKKSGSVIASFMLQRPGETPVKIAVLELAKFEYDDGKLFRISKSGTYMNGYVGPVFYADAGTTVTAEIEYKYDKKVAFNITPLVTEAMGALNGIGFLGKKIVVPADAAAKVAAYEKALGDHFSSAATRVSSFSLSFDTGGGTNAVYSALDVNRTIPGKGFLFAGVDRLPSILVDPPAPGSPLLIANGGYGIGSTSPVRDRRIQGKDLKDYFITALGEDYQQLYRQDSPTDFLAATNRLWSVVDAADLALVNADKVAALWAMIATNRLMADPIVRANYVLHADEKYMKELGLGLPDLIQAPMTATEKAIMAAGEAGMVSAQASVTKARSAYSQAENAALRSLTFPLAADLQPPKNAGSCSYRGEKVQSNATFYGQVTSLASDAANNVYEGQISWPGNIPIFQGAGRYTFAKGEIESYIGDFQGNYFHGFGRMTWRNGEYFLGSFANDKPSGFGVLFTGAGRYFVNYLEGKPDGASLFVSHDGSRKTGEWINGTFISVPQG